jgi:hypothetical protein
MEGNETRQKSFRHFPGHYIVVDDFKKNRKFLNKNIHKEGSANF